MEAISPEIRLRLAPGEPRPEPREWLCDVERGTLRHVPTGAMFHVYAASRQRAGARRSPTYDEGSMRARLVRIRDDFPIPSPAQIDELGRVAIRRFLELSLGSLASP
jgi:hypothetical protein